MEKVIGSHMRFITMVDLECPLFLFFFILFGGLFTNEPYCLSFCGMSSVVSRMFRM